MNDGNFYLGKEVKKDGKTLKEEKFLYEADNLTTHAMVFGMTGSGKTGLCIDLIEEAISEEIPLILIDPKGDLTNLKLMYPDFSPKNFEKWVSLTDAEKRGMTKTEYAHHESKKWMKGLENWDIDSKKVKTVKDKADIHIYTPGSSAGEKISILNGFAKPEESFEDDEEGMIEKIRNSVSALLSLLDIENDPLKSKPHILISNIIEHYWRLDKGISIEELIINIQKPPIKKLGVFDIEQMINKRERAELAFNINNIIASSGFRYWSSGTPLSAGELFKVKKEGTVPVNIFYIAHLPENERMFFVSLLLNEIVYWIRKQSGSGNLKYILYMDEIFGYLPPYPLNPPSKNPLLILLKQARAFGLGVVLATQNPKDVDYKGLTNMGTWFVGKLQAEGDRERVLEGLEGISDKSGNVPNRKELENTITSLKKRSFLIKNIHSEGLKVFQTRWAMSYLVGPLTKNQIKLFNKNDSNELLEDKKVENIIEKPNKSRPHLLLYMPQAPVGIENLFDNSNKSGTYYTPKLYLNGKIIFDEKNIGLYLRKDFFAIAELSKIINWKKASFSEEAPNFEEDKIESIDGFKPFDVILNYSTLNNYLKDFKNFIFTQLSIKIFVNKALNITSEADESEEAFKLKCRNIVDKMIDKEIENIKEKYLRKINRLLDKAEQEELRIEKLETEYKSKKTEEFVSAGESILGFLLGSKSRRGLSSAARRRRATSSAKNRIKLKENKLEQINDDIQDLREELEDKVADIEDNLFDKADMIEKREIRLEKNDIIISNHNILWKLI